MIKSMAYITASCVIGKETVYKDGQLFFSGGSGAATGGLATPPGPADFLSAVYEHFDLQYPKFYKMDNLSRLGWITAELLLRDAQGLPAYRPEEVAVVLSNSNSSLDTDRKYAATIAEIPSPSVFVYTLPNIMIGEICIRHGFKGENAFFLSPGFDPDFLVTYNGCLLEQGTAKACITGWVDLLGDEYKAALFLVEGAEAAGRTEGTGVTVFSAETMNRVFQTATS
jgi:hypothetical protein